MADAGYVLLIVLFFVLAWLFAGLCDRISEIRS
jgi:hypothetical protein